MASGSSPSYLIVGAGVFGVSTAYHLIQKYPNASVTIVDRDPYDGDNRTSASWDWNKVVRADYDDIVYCRLALEAQDVFKSDPLWQPYFHETGVYWICRNDYAQNVINNYKKLGRKADLYAVSVEEAKKLYGGLYAEADYSGAKEVLINKTSGWGAAGDSLRAITRECLRLGVQYVVANVATLEIDGSGRCTGVQTATGEVLSAAHVILSTGAFTSKLLEFSAARSGNDDLRAGDRIVAGGITTGMVTLDPEEHKKYKDMPVGFQGYDPSESPFLGSLPPTKDRELKWWGGKIFSNISQVLPGRYVSAPPDEPDYAQWKVSGPLKEDISRVCGTFYGGRASHWQFEKHRICWDAFTSTGDFIISPHAGAKGLYVATCGSFHGYKFFPIIGKYVVQMLDSELEPELVTKWAWNRDRPDPSLNAEYPRAEMRDLADPTARL